MRASAHRCHHPRVETHGGAARRKRAHRRAEGRLGREGGRVFGDDLLHSSHRVERGVGHRRHGQSHPSARKRGTHTEHLHARVYRGPRNAATFPGLGFGGRRLPLREFESVAAAARDRRVLRQVRAPRGQLPPPRLRHQEPQLLQVHVHQVDQEQTTRHRKPPRVLPRSELRAGGRQRREGSRDLCRAGSEAPGPDQARVPEETPRRRPRPQGSRETIQLQTCGPGPGR
mmetsp:Transcript_52792/g.120322  ORF Transcript_52792/g.120322 Transcript_52792/m.120322 type:complete len:229 (-) Transcript_52792:319-1005(-)